ncbi:hypothetical protein [Marivita hallyeonensis]|uniref:hypothetical protein n=1 Tax=Marivita hallyeonensis TaxID=996342 RepID=UPI0009351D3D|nr:hypothetical protein [Marivita hallyeonensis]
MSNSIDFIRGDDPSAFHCLAYTGVIRAEMPDKRSDVLFVDDVFAYLARFRDGTDVPIWIHPDIGSEAAARDIARPAVEALGKLPTAMRGRLNHVVIHSGNETAFAEDEGRFFVLYSENIKTRLRDNDLEETVFHESVHATLDVPFLRDAAWLAAQAADGAFITEYAARHPAKEDFAESALFAWALLQHPGRLPLSFETRVRTIMPNRLAFFETLLNDGPVFTRTDLRPDC